VNITLKNVPEKIAREIKREAKKQGRSLNAQMIRSLESVSADLERRRQLSKVRKELDRFAASVPPLDDSTPLIRQDRRR
jgi:hypothetical protein